ncbi:hypothetical protein AbraIFM66950_000025 [Aspergillus brasiliensis]|nr:hypothetical protein AbraIFM66950_000025 [Aspergillus brasiliensis]
MATTNSSTEVDWFEMEPAKNGMQSAEAVTIWLQHAGIPCAFIGEIALKSYGFVSSNKLGTSLIVADEKVEEAALILLLRGLERCSEGGNCTWEDDNLTNQSSSPASYHYHLNHGPQADPPHWSESLNLYKKSQIDPTLPDPGLGAPAPGDLNYTVVTDPRLPEWGRWKTSACPIQILTHPRFVETLFNQAVNCNPKWSGDKLAPWEWKVLLLKAMLGDPHQPEHLVALINGLEEPVRRYIELFDVKDLKRSRAFIDQVRLAYENKRAQRCECCRAVNFW